MVELKLPSKLSDKEVRNFKILNTLPLESFNAMQYAMCIGAVYRDSNKKYQYIPEYSMTYINTNITPNKLISFCELHKDMIIKNRIYTYGHFATIYYIRYVREEKPMILNAFNNYSTNRVDVELTICDNGFYRIDEVHMELSPYTSVITGVSKLFSNENIEALPFISTKDNHYHITLYDDYGREKQFAFPTIEYIYNCITNIRLVGCEKVS